MRRPLSALLMGVLFAIPASCTHDIVGTDSPQPVCGNLILEPGEQCDIASPGCVNCLVVPTWSCDQRAQSCAEESGDGVVPAVSGGAPTRALTCDMTGYWAVRETSFARDSVLDSVQTASNWFLYHLSQTGSDFYIDEELDCGIEVTGSATVSYTEGSLAAMIYANRMDALAPEGPRHGTAFADGSGCDVSLDRWYKVRGADDSFLPSSFSDDAGLASLPPVPTISDPVNDDDLVDGGGGPAGATDPDGDGFLGVAFSVGGLVAGVRDSTQRDWEQYATLSGQPVVANALELVVPGTFDSEEHVLHVSQCGDGCSLLASVSHPATDIAPYVTFMYIGSELGGSRVSQVVMAAPRTSLTADLATCAHVRLMLPHNPDAPQN